MPYRGEPWKPVYKNPSAETYVSFVDAAGEPVDVYIAVYDHQYEGHEIVGWGQGAIEALDEGGWQWAANARGPAGGQGFSIKKGGATRDVLQFYRVNGTMVGSPERAKIEGLKARLLGGDPQAATLLVAAERVDSLVSSRPALDRFLAASGAPSAVIDRAIVKER